jgi:hypothetical protein
MTAVRRLVPALLALISLQCAAAPFAVQLGDVKVALDAPPGFADTTETGSPRLRDLAESLTSASNRVLMFALTDADLRRFTVGDSLEAKRYVIVVSPRGLERDFITPKAFSTFVSDSLRELGQLPPAGTSDYRKHLDTFEGRPALLAELRRDPQVVSVLQGARLPAIDGRTDLPKYMLTTTTLILLRGKALNLGVFSNYDSPTDVDWIRTLTARWVDELQRLNSR